MERLSVVVITLNEAERIGTCLESVRSVADEIVVVDSFSSDETEKICRQHGARFVQRKFDGYGPQKRYAVSLASNDWVLNLDADEALDAEARLSILRALEHTDESAYSFWRFNNYYGRVMKSNYLKRNHIARLFDRRKVNFSALPVHENVVLGEEKAPLLRGKIMHWCEPNIAAHKAKSERYAEKGAAMLRQQGRKIGALTVWAKTAFKFVAVYLFRLHFIDGYYGAVISYMAARTTYKKYNGARN